MSFNCLFFSLSFTTTTFQGWRLYPEGAVAETSKISFISSSGTSLVGLKKVIDLLSVINLRHSFVANLPRRL